MYFDTHAHLDDEKFNGDRQQVITAMKEAGVGLMVNIGANMESSAASIALAEQYDFIYAAVGVHPNETGTLCEADFDRLAAMARHPKVVAIGEIGLDYHWDEPERPIQQYWFTRQIALAKELSLPYIVHDREAHQDTVSIIRNSAYYRGVMHCYSGSAEMARQLTELGFFISFTGTVTFKNAAKVREAAAAVPPNLLMAETDSPYLAPEPHRGKRNSPVYVPYVVQKLAEVKQVPEDEMKKLLWDNGKRFFQIP